jgi:hypothetical protein
LAFQQAQDALPASADVYEGLPSIERLQAASAEAEAMAERRFGEISAALYDLTRAVGGNRERRRSAHQPGVAAVRRT